MNDDELLSKVEQRMSASSVERIETDLPVGATIFILLILNTIEIASIVLFFKPGWLE